MIYLTEFFSAFLTAVMMENLLFTLFPMYLMVHPMNL